MADRLRRDGSGAENDEEVPKRTFWANGITTYLSDPVDADFDFPEFAILNNSQQPNPTPSSPGSHSHP